MAISYKTKHMLIRQSKTHIVKIDSERSWNFVIQQPAYKDLLVLFTVVIMGKQLMSFTRGLDKWKSVIENGTLFSTQNVSYQANEKAWNFDVYYSVK